jgi:hypothetical protein
VPRPLVVCSRYWRLPKTVCTIHRSPTEVWSTTMGDVDDRIPPLPASVVQALRVEGLPPCTIQAMADGTWHVTMQLAADEQAALASAPTPDELCRRAQHALGLAGRARQAGAQLPPAQLLHRAPAVWSHAMFHRTLPGWYRLAGHPRGAPARQVPEEVVSGRRRRPSFRSVLQPIDRCIVHTVVGSRQWRAHTKVGTR